MMKIFSAMALAGLMTVAATGGSQAQDRTLRKITSGQPAAIPGAMTQAQARKACQMEMSGARESKKSLRIKMDRCVNAKMQGNG